MKLSLLLIYVKRISKLLQFLLFAIRTQNVNSIFILFFGKFYLRISKANTFGQTVHKLCRFKARNSLFSHPDSIPRWVFFFFLITFVLMTRFHRNILRMFSCFAVTLVLSQHAPKTPLMHLKPCGIKHFKTSQWIIRTFVRSEKYVIVFLLFRAEL